MSGSEDTNDFKSESSPCSQNSNYSPYSSPSQQVPQLANFISELKCTDTNRLGPHLDIIEEPTNHFRFRYKSEMIGTHGCLLGKSNSMVKSKTYPTVELKNYTGSARIRCTLARHDRDQEHPHKLQDDQERDLSSVVPEQGYYRVAFSGMGIIHTAKKDVAALLFQKYMQENKISSRDENKLRVQCEKAAKEINLNIVRLKFSAHDLKTDKEICTPVFSQPIHNLKSAATNDLKICRMSRSDGHARGGDDVFLLVEKVKKSNIIIRFFELDENGERGWTAKGNFLQADVHHQYAIVFRTPPYKNQQIKSDVDVFIELVRPSDGRTSEPKPFKYRAHPLHRQNKKRKANTSFSSLDSNADSLKSSSEYPVPISLIQSQLYNNEDHAMEDIPRNIIIKFPQNVDVPTQHDDLGDAILNELSADASPAGLHALSPMLSAPPMSNPPVLQINSSELARLTEPKMEAPLDDRQQFLSGDFTDYFKLYSNEFPEMSFNNYAVVADSGGAADSKTHSSNQKAINKNTRNTKGEYSEVYKAGDGLEVKKLVKEICESIRNKTGQKEHIATVKAKLERLFEMRLSNADTFLHMTYCTNQPSLEYIVKLIHNMKMTKLLNLGNNQMRTILHQAIINDDKKSVVFFVSKGCDPMVEDNEGNNAVHYAVIYQRCLDALLESIETLRGACDLDAYNNEKQSALHLACLHSSVESVSQLIRAGASLDARDRAARTPLHLAVLGDCLPVVRELLDASKQSVIDAVDETGYTALQMACDAPLRENTLEILKLLLERKANAMKQCNGTQPPWKLAKDKPEVLEILHRYVNVPVSMCEDDIKSEPEDDYESADDLESVENGALPELQLYIAEVAPLLDRSGKWRELARRLQRDNLESWYGGNASPTTVLLNHIKTYEDNLPSKSLALLLEDMGETHAARIIRNYLND